ncbi:hypothetical protein J2W49_001184 [Hydrogenophaga palleronii]|uniref:Uncharacterized protein n=1 Tax=Hydrogenophaga palleronii TaxID=65655 RepID=A0ABU1WIY0_9BURK|nr:hypothetical protein [Hydrogenophaga palleronii]MDR7149235.1 hypothetical protein [Hydrogenophaga palleronii]
MNLEVEKSDEPLLGRVIAAVEKHLWEIGGWGLYIAGTAIVLFSFYKRFYGVVDPTKFNAEVLGNLAIFGMMQFGILLMGVAALFGIIYRVHRKQEWIYKTTLWTFDRVREYGLHLAQKDPVNERTVSTQHWPWGGHHTAQLAHLEAAAHRFWTLYDPSDTSTAPTNEMVADWLMQERGVAKDKARAIASILRADGLPAGRR